MAPSAVYTSTSQSEYDGFNHRVVGHINDCFGLMAVLRCVTDEVTSDNDINDLESFPEIPIPVGAGGSGGGGSEEWSLVKCSADRYWGLAWPDATIFLRKLQAEDDGDTGSMNNRMSESELNRVFTVLASMKTYVRPCSSCLPWLCCRTCFLGTNFPWSCYCAIGFTPL